jgi:hypothetical protein
MEPVNSVVPDQQRFLKAGSTSSGDLLPHGTPNNPVNYQLCYLLSNKDRPLPKALAEASVLASRSELLRVSVLVKLLVLLKAMVWGQQL